VTPQANNPSGRDSPNNFGVILAGGQSRRMSGCAGAVDKAVHDLGGRRLIDHVVARFAPQVGRILIAGPSAYGTQLTALADGDDGPRGPAAALWSCAKWIAATSPGAPGFVTVPVDGPFAPPDMAEKLSASGRCAIASNDNGLHPTFAYWALSAIMDRLKAVPKGEGVALHILAQQCDAAHVHFDPPHALMNINTRDDMARARKLVQTLR